MIDFVAGITKTDYSKIDGYDRERAKQKAFMTVIPLIMENELTEQQSICIRYKYFAHKTQTEIANLLKLSQPTVSRHISAGKQTLNNSLNYCYIALTKAIDEYEKLSNEIH